MRDSRHRQRCPSNACAAKMKDRDGKPNVEVIRFQNGRDTCLCGFACEDSQFLELDTGDVRVAP